MKKIEWNDYLSVGIELIDEDHKHLISIINKLFIELDNNSDKIILEKIFEELEDYTHYHFDREENLMLQNHSTLENEKHLESHILQHKIFIKAIPKLKEKLLNSSSSTVSFDIVDFLSHWLLEHIITEDLSLTQSFKKLEEQSTCSISNSTCDNIVNKLNQKLSFSTRALLIFIIPFMTIILISSILTFEIYEKYKDSSNSQKISNLFICINKLTNSLQLERGLSSGYINSNYTNFSTTLLLQRESTDDLLNSCKTQLSALYTYKNINLKLFKQEAKSLTKIREKIDAKKLKYVDVITYYSDQIDSLLNIVKEANHIHFDKNIENLHNPLIIFLYLKEANGLLRAEGTTLLQNRKKNLKTFKELLILDRAYFNSLKLLSNKKFFTYITDIDNSLNSTQLRTMQDDIMYFKPIKDGNENLWFKKMSIKINAYESVIDIILQKINKSASISKRESLFFINILWSTLLIIMSITILISFALRQSIVKPIESFTTSMMALASGDKTFYFNSYKSNDFIGKMTAAFDSFRRSLIKADFADILLDIQEYKTNNFERLAYLDPLTNTINRRKYRELIQTEFNKASSCGKDLTILALDLDKFKNINDSYGHNIGDIVLKKFSKTVQETIRPDDYLARLGGEEFSLILPGASKEISIEIAKRVLKSVQSMDFSNIDKDLFITVSIGISFYASSHTIESMLKKADEKLYKAKNSGRNKICY